MGSPAWRTRGYLTYRGRVPGPLFQIRGQRGKNRNGVLEAYRHRLIATLTLYVDEHDRKRTQTTLADLVASTLTP
jgi:hypothetical protein